MIMYLLRANQESDYNAMVAYLKDKGYTWKDGKELTYKEAKESLGNDKRKVMLLQGSHVNDYQGGNTGAFITVTCLSKVNKLKSLLNQPAWTMDNVQTIIPLEYYNI
ncbi:hypothetical protein iF6_191 [Enterococcus phage iF6]|uniref:Uncharacterized protein n=1 Tax=Enterococcus phage iF6 TaxID=2765371 RepID=A0A7G8ZYT2_9CAUD|nr:hypothetical protein iF6_4 [Enterococcus phage iF6]QNL29550.1 hypothetical protein iF6_191 [Enterococcus phage iF6]